MYPDWPETDADLVPLPQCIGPKLKPFSFQGGPQRIEFLKYLGEGSHAHVFEVKIRGQLYALKLFRFVYDDDWIGPEPEHDHNDRELMSAFYNYSEPFSCECRAYGRLQEAGHEDLVLKCFGYVLLDEAHEQAMMTQFSDLDLEFNGNMDYPGSEDVRSRFLGKDGRAPPIRGIIKELGLPDKEENLNARVMRKILGDMFKLRKLGIFRIDAATRQILSYKLCDLSMAFTVPHFMATPELNPHLTPEMISAMELETFKACMNDYFTFDDMIFDWNLDYGKEKGTISTRAFPDGRGCQLKYNLRSQAARDRIYTFVDPRKYDWRSRSVSAGSGGKETIKLRRSKRLSKGGKHGKPQGVGPKKPLQLTAKPSLWYYDCEGWQAERLRRGPLHSLTQKWDYKEGFIFPRIEAPFIPYQLK
ncbi:kinetochore Sim4 complex subunit FTA2-domain-containing protein [Bombardia bombarda]|uniref:Kinetochore Sim4 complex subunit FTA2-domain-containing protein n=1 Tax=Bombardia bombarda TaxID=252184 RepID=A0AA39WMM6_9PEZI|nr:kinetochore Sim4 complex subunit FTA2-domain-containing protein [Bombardia bombarda]